jgi:hypothetical protein
MDAQVMVRAGSATAVNPIAMSPLQRAFITVIVVAALGGGIYEAREASALRRIAQALGDEQTASSNHIAELETSLSRAEARRTEAEGSVDRLTARMQELLKRDAAQAAARGDGGTTKGQAAPTDGSHTNGMSAMMGRMMKAVAAQQVEGKLAALKARLNLTPEQEAAIRGILSTQAEKKSEMAQRMFGGGGSLTNDAAQAGQYAQTTNDQIKAVLTPEQATAYDAFESEEQVQNSRLMANLELTQIQPLLHLDEAQQDKVFSALAGQYQTQLAERQTNAGAASNFRGEMDSKAEALRPVLTPEQFEGYRRFQEQQLNLMETLRQGGGQ